MANVAFNPKIAATSLVNAANQSGGGVKTGNGVGRFSCFSVRNWPGGFKDAVRWGAETLAQTISGKPIEKRVIENAVDHDQGRRQEVNRTDKTENSPIKTSSQEPVESKKGGMPSGSNSAMVKVLALMTQISSASGQESTTLAPVTTTAQALSQEISFDRAVFAQAAKECTELMAFLTVALTYALTDEQKTAANKALIICSSAFSFLVSWGGVGAGFAHLLASQIGSGEKTDLLIKSIEGATKLWAAYKLHQLNQLSKEIVEQQEEAQGGDSNAPDMETGRTGTNTTTALPRQKHEH